MKVISVVFFSVLLSGCSSLAVVTSYIPSFWDDNQSSKIIDVRQSVNDLDCSKPQNPQVVKIQKDLEWFKLYSESKGSRQQDVLKIIGPMRETVDDMVKRTTGQESSKAYCELKKSVMITQSTRAAKAVLGRF